MDFVLMFVPVSGQIPSFYMDWRTYCGRSRGYEGVGEWFERGGIGDEFWDGLFGEATA